MATYRNISQRKYHSGMNNVDVTRQDHDTDYIVIFLGDDYPPEHRAKTDHTTYHGK